MKRWVLNKIRAYLSNENRCNYTLNVTKDFINTLKHV